MCYAHFSLHTLSRFHTPFEVFSGYSQGNNTFLRATRAKTHICETFVPRGKEENRARRPLLESARFRARIVFNVKFADCEYGSKRTRCATRRITRDKKLRETARSDFLSPPLASPPFLRPLHTEDKGKRAARGGTIHQKKKASRRNAHNMPIVTVALT